MSSKFNIRNELISLYNSIKTLDKKVVIIFLSVAVLQTISWYLTSRNFFRENYYYQYFTNYRYKDLIEYLFWFFTDFITLLIIPVIIIKYVFKEHLKDYGIQFGDKKTGITFTLLFTFIMLPVLWLLSASPEFSVNYPQLQSAKENRFIFIIYETALFIYLFAWEFIWRGYMLFGLEKKFGYYSVFIQMIPFVILHNGKPVLETFGAIIGALVLGVLALRTRSYLYGVFVHFAVLLGIDLFSLIRYKFALVARFVPGLF